MEGFITQHMRFVPLFIILAMGLTLLSNTAMSMKAADMAEPSGYQERAATIPGSYMSTNASEDHAEKAVGSNETAAEPPGYQDRAATIPGFSYWLGLITLLFVYSLISLKR